MKRDYKYNKLRGRIIEKYGSMSSFAKKIGITDVSMSNKMQCKTGFSQGDIKCWCELLDIQTNEIGIYFFE